MEEQKIGSKGVKMKPVINSQNDTQNVEGSLTEELQKWTKDKLIQQVVQMDRQLYSQNIYVNRLKDQISEMQNYFSNKRMEYLLKIVEITNNYKASGYPCFDKAFVEECLTEIQDVLTVPEEADKNEDSKEK